jgi:hypothetical protein
MNKVASTINLVNAIRVYEEMYGPSVITSIEAVNNSSCLKYVVKTRDKDGNEHRINVPAIEEDTFWRNQDHG